MAIRCRESARPCGAKHIWKSKVSKTAGFKPILRCQLTNLTNFSHSTNNYNTYNKYNNSNSYNYKYENNNSNHYTTLNRTALQLPLQQLLHLQLQFSYNYNYNFNYTALLPTTSRSISGFTLRSIIHSNEPPIGFLSLKLPPPPCAVHIGSNINIAVFEVFVHQSNMYCSGPDKKRITFAFAFMCSVCCLHLFPLSENLTLHFRDFVCRSCQAERLRFLAPSPLSSPVAALVTGKRDKSKGV